MKSVIVHGVLATVGLILAWWVWSGGETKRHADVEVDIITCTAARLEKVEFVTPEKTITLDVSKGEGPRAWFRHTTTEAKPTVQRFAAGSKVDGLLERLAPLKAIRALGEVAADKLATLELAEPKRTLQITCGGKTHKLVVGATTYGASSRYVREVGGGAVFLVKASLISDLEMSRARFMQRDLLDLRLPEVAEVKVRARQTERTLLHRDRRNPAGANWVDAGAPDQRNELYGNWLTRVMRLRALEYVAQGVEPGADLSPPAKPAAVVELTFSGDKSGRVELVKVPGKAADYFARSSTTGGWVKVPATLGRQVEDDVAVVLGLEAPAPATPPPAPATPTAAAPTTAAPTGPPAHGVPGSPALRLPPAPRLAVPGRPMPVPVE